MTPTQRRLPSSPHPSSLPPRDPLIRTPLRRIAGTCAAACVALGSLVSAATQPQNVLFIIGDDIGIDAIGQYGLGATPPPTPTLDTLASQGVRFMNAWASPLCSPTRAALISGRYGFRTGVGYTIVPSTPQSGTLSLDELTVPKALKGAGTGHALGAIGKWNLGNDGAGNWDPDSPILHGFDYYAGNLSHTIFPNFFSWEKVVNDLTLVETTTTSTTYATTDNVDDSITWINAQGSNPWLLWLAFNAAHSPFHKPPVNLHSYDTLADPPTGSSVPYYKAMIEALDTEIGRLLANIPQPVLDNTTIIFMGDNGTPSQTTDYFDPNRVKFTLYQGGVMVPLIIAGPCVNGPGREVDSIVNATDIFATIMELAGADFVSQLPPDTVVDSLSMVPYLENPSQPALRTWTLAERFQPSTNNNDEGQAVRTQQYKLIRFDNRAEEFYNLVADPLELNNLVASGPGSLTGSALTDYNKLNGVLDTLAAGELPPPDLFSFARKRPGNANVDVGVRVRDYNHGFSFLLEQTDDFSEWLEPAGGQPPLLQESGYSFFYEVPIAADRSFYRIAVTAPEPPDPPDPPQPPVGSVPALITSNSSTGNVLELSTTAGTGTIIGATGLADLNGLAYDAATGILYGIDVSTDTLVRVNPFTGEATTVGSLGVDFPNTAGLAFDPYTGTLYATSDGSAANLYTVNVSTGATTLVGALGQNITGLAFVPATGTLYGVSGATDSLYTINTSTGAITLVGALGTDIARSGLAYDAQSATLFLTNGNSGELFSVDLATGAATLVGATGATQPWGLAAINTAVPAGGLFASNTGLDELLDVSTTTAAGSVIGATGTADLNGMAMDANTGTLYGIDVTTDTLLRVNPFTGATFTVGPLGVDFPSVAGLAFDPATSTLYATGNGAAANLYTVDIVTGAATSVGALGTNIPGLAFVPGEGLYGVGGGTDELFTIDVSTGVATAVGSLGTDIAQAGLTYDGASTSLYLSNGLTGDLFTLNRTTGAATLLGNVGFSQVRGLASDNAALPPGLLLVSNTGLDELLEVSTVDASDTLLGSTGTLDLNGLATDTANRIVYGVDVNTDTLVTVDPETGTTNTIGSLGVDLVSIAGLAHDSANGILYASSSGAAANLYIIDKATGAASVVGPLGTNMPGLAFDSDAGVLYGVSGQTDSLYTIDTSTAATTLVGAVGADFSFAGLTWDVVSGALYLSDGSTGDLFRLDSSTGAGTLIGDIGFLQCRGLATQLGPEQPATVLPALIASDSDSGDVLDLSLGTGAGSIIGASGAADLNGLAYDSATGILYGIDVATDTLVEVNPFTGAATSIGSLGVGFPFTAGLAFDPYSGTLYATSDGSASNLHTVDVTTGTATVVGALGLNITGLAFIPATGTLYGVSGATDSLYTINTATGATTLVGALGTDTGRSGLAYDARTATLFLTNGNTGELFAVNAATGAATLVGNTGAAEPWGLAAINTLAPSSGIFASNTGLDELLAVSTTDGTGSVIGATGTANLNGMALDADTGILYGLDVTTDTLLRVNPFTGATFTVGPLGVDFPSIAGLAFDPASKTLYATGNSTAANLYTVDIVTGAATVVGALGTNVPGLAFVPGEGLYGVGGLTDELFTINTTIGLATPVGPLGTDIAEAGLTYDGATSSLYLSDGNTGDVFTLDRTTGSATLLGNTGYLQSRGMASNNAALPLGALLASNTGLDELLELSTLDGTNTVLGATGTLDLNGLATDTVSRVVYGVDVNTDTLVRVDPVTGAATTVGSLGVDLISVAGLAHDPFTGTLYASSSGTAANLYTISKATGAATLVGALGTNVPGLAFDADAGVLYGVSGVDNSLHTIDTSTAATTLVGEVGVSFSFAGLSWDEVSGALYLSDGSTGDLFRLDSTTGAGTYLGNIGFLQTRGLAAKLPPAPDQPVGDLPALIASDSNAGDVLDLSRFTGSGTIIGASGVADLNGLAYDPATGILYGIDVATDTLVRVDPFTGASITVGSLGVDFPNTAGLAYDPYSGTLYATSDNAAANLYTIDVSTGTATLVGALGTNITGLAYVPATGTLYGVSGTTDSLYTINTATGAITLVGALGTNTGRSGLAYDARTATLFLTNGSTGELFSVNRSTGAATLVGDTGADEPWGLAAVNTVAPTGGLFATNTGLDDLLDVSPTTGVGSVIGATGTASLSGLALDANTGILYGIEINSDTLRRVNPFTGATFTVGPLGVDFPNVAGLAFDPATKTLYATSNGATANLYTVNVTSGAATVVGALGTNVPGLAFVPGEGLFGVGGGTDELFSIDTATGAATAIGSLGTDISEAGLTYDGATDALYLSNGNTGEVFTLNRTTGSATLLGNTGYLQTRGFASNNTAFPPGTLLVSNTGLDELLELSTVDAANTLVGPTGTLDLNGLATDTVNRIIYGVDVNTDTLVAVDPATGVATTVGPLGVDLISVAGLAHDPSTGTLYASSSGAAANLYTIDKVTGAASVVGALGTNVPGLAFDADAGLLYGVSGVDNSLHTIDTSTAAITLVGGIGVGISFAGLTWDDVSGALYLSDGSNGNLFRLDSTTGAGTYVGNIGFLQCRGLATKLSPGTLYGSVTSSGDLLEFATQDPVATVTATTGLTALHGMAMDSNTGDLYGIDVSTDTLLHINQATGQTVTLGALGVDFPNVAGLAHDPATNTLYASSNSPADNLYTVDTTTGAATLVGPLGANIPGLAFAADEGVLYGVAGATDELFTIDTATGATTLVGPLGVDTGFTGLAFDATTRSLYMTLGSSGSLYRLNRSTGAATLMGTTGVPNQYGLAALNALPPEIGVFASDAGSDELLRIAPGTGAATSVGSTSTAALNGLALNVLTGVLYGIDVATDQLVTVDKVSGEATPVGPLGVNFPSVAGLACEPRSGTLYASSNSPVANLYTVDPLTGAASLVGAIGQNMPALAYVPAEGTLYGISGQTNSLYTVDTATGSPTLVGALGISVSFCGLSYDVTSNQMLLTDGSAGDLYAVNRGTGAATPIGGTGYAAPRGLASPNGVFTDVVAFASDTVNGDLVSVALANAATSVIGAMGVSDVGAIVLDPNTGIYYCIDAAADELRTIDTATGATAVVGPLGVDFRSAGLAYDAIRDIIYASSSNVAANLYIVNKETGAATMVGPLGLNMQSLAWVEEENTLYGVSGAGNGLYTIDLTTGAATLVGSLGIDVQRNGLDYNPDDDLLYMSDGLTGDIYTVNRTTGAASFIGSTGLLGLNGLAIPRDAPAPFDLVTSDVASDQVLLTSTADASSIAVGSSGTNLLSGLAKDPFSGTVYGLDYGTDSLYTVDTLTGATTLIGTTGANFDSAAGLAYDSHAGVLYATGNGAAKNLYTVDPTTGVATVVGSLSAALPALAYVPSEDMLYGVSGATETLYTVDKTTGSLTAIGNIGFDISQCGLGYDFETDTLFLGDGNTGDLYSVDRGSGATTLVGSTGLDSPFGLAGTNADASLLSITGTTRTAGEVLSISPVGANTVEKGTTGLAELNGLARDTRTGTVYGVDVASDTLVILNEEDGTTETVGPLVVDLPNTAGLAFDPLSGTLYLVSNSTAANLYTVNTNTGRATVVGPLGTNFTGLAFVPSENTLYGTSGVTNSLHTIDVATGTPTLVGALGFSFAFSGLTYDEGTDQLVFSGGSTNDLYVLNRSTGAATSLGSHGYARLFALASPNLGTTMDLLGSTTGTDIVGRISATVEQGIVLGSSGLSDLAGMAMDVETGTVYGIDVATDSLVTVDPRSGAATTVGALGVDFPNTAGLAYDPAARVLYASSNGTAANLYTVSTDTGVASLVGSLGVSMPCLAYVPAEGLLYGVSGQTDLLYTIDTATGTPTPVGSIGQDVSFCGLAYDFATDSLILTGHASGVMYEINRTTGASTGIGFSGIGLVYGLAAPNIAEPSRALIGSEVVGDTILSWSEESGIATSKGATAVSNLRGLAKDVNSGLVYGINIDLDRLITVNPDDGQATLVGDLGVDFPNTAGLAFDPVGDILYASSDGAAANLYTLDTTTGAATSVGALGVNMPSLAYVPSEGVLYGVSGQTDMLYTINTTTGAATAVGSIGTDAANCGLAYDAASDALYLSHGQGTLYEVDRTTGATTVIGASGFNGTLGLTADNQ